ncbi:MAG: HD domain-containing protein, partial [Candidatus Eisenbacteria bacterium]|nr:HD domain-containing protein [Candidatus Eisenbacteria bacterium]
AMATYQRALQLVELFTSPTRAAGGELRHLKRIVQPLVDAALGGEASPGFAPGAAGRPTAGEHALQVAMAAIQVGAKLGLDRRTLAELGAGALLHDTGKAGLAAELREPPAEWTPAQHEIARRHPLEGLKQIARGSSLNESSMSAMRIALEHHTFGPQPYPSLPANHTRSPLSEIVAIADAWVTLASGDRSPHEALGAVLGPLGAGFDPAVRAALVRALGLYPPGQRVELDDGSLASVIHACATDPARPGIEWLTGPARQPLAAETSGSAGPLPPERHIVRALPRAEWPAPAQDAA